MGVLPLSASFIRLFWLSGALAIPYEFQDQPFHFWREKNSSWNFDRDYNESVGFPSGISSKEPTCQCRRLKRCGFNPLGQEDPLEEGMATHSHILAWRIPWTEEPGGLQSMGSHRADTTVSH